MNLLRCSCRPSRALLGRSAKLLLALVMLAALVPAAAFAEANDTYPGIPLPASPVNGSLGEDNPQDIYSVQLAEGETLNLALYVSEESARVSIMQPSGASAMPLETTTAYPGYPGVLSFFASAPGTYYVQLSQGFWECGYTLGWSITPAVAPVIQVSTASVALTMPKGGPNPQPVYVSVSNGAAGGRPFTWTAASNQPWLGVTSSGQASEGLWVSFGAGGLGLGTYRGTVTVSTPGATSVVIPVELRVLRKATISSKATTKAVGYNGKVTLSAKLKDSSGAPIKGRTLTLYRMLSDDEWTKVKSVSSKTGSYKATVRIKYKTRFQWRYAGSSKYAAATSKSRTTRCRAYVTPPKVAKVQGFYTLYKGKGTVKPEVREGASNLTVRYYARKSGYWSLIRTETVPCNDGVYVSQCKWSGWGRWKMRVRASYRDADHVLTHSAWRYFRVQ